MHIELLLYRQSENIFQENLHEATMNVGSAQNQTWMTLHDASDPLKFATANSFIFQIQCRPPHLFMIKPLKLISLEQQLI